MKRVFFIILILVNYCQAQTELTKMKKVGNRYYDHLNKYTGEPHTFTVVTEYADGTPMTDEKCDGVIYRKVSGEYVKLNYTGPANVKWFGAVGDGITDDTEAFEKALVVAKSVICEGTYLVTSSINLPSNTFLDGKNNCKIVASGDRFAILSAFNKETITIRNISFYGNGSNNNEGLNSLGGISLDGVSNYEISGCKFYNFGNMNINPVNDANNGGFGIMVSDNVADSNNGLISNCFFKKIAGSNYWGDGITVVGSFENTTYTNKNITIINCYATECGRHGYSVAAPANHKPFNISIINCYAEKTGLDGIDIEEANEVVIDGCKFYKCGNDQSFFNPALAFGENFNLLAAVAVSNDSRNIAIKNTAFNNCYFGITYGASEDITIENCVFSESEKSDLTQGLASGAKNLRIKNCSFQSDKSVLNYYNVNPSGLAVEGSVFAGSVQLPTVIQATFKNCDFKKGISFNGAGSKRVLIEGGVINSTTSGIDISGNNHQNEDISITNVVFQGAMQYGIKCGYLSTVDLSVTGCTFSNMTIAGIFNGNCGNSYFLKSVTGNKFNDCANAIELRQAFKGAIIRSNYFSNVTGWCILIADIFSPDKLENIILSENFSKNSCVNGLGISNSTGEFDRCIITTNNFSSCSGSKISLSAGNANGININNIQ